MERGDLPDPAARGGDARRRPLRELRCRPRLPVPVQLLHHHQRAGPQVALPHRRRCRRHRARQCQAEHHALLHHRRQLRAQQELGADPRPPDRICARRKASRSACCCRSTRCATRSRASSRRRRAPAAPRCSSGSRTSIRQSLAGAKKRQNKIWEYQEMFHAWRKAKVMTFAGLHSRLPDRHAGIDRARHRDHQEGIAGRYPRVLLSDAAAGLRGPQGPAPEGRAGRSGPEQIRSRTRLHRASDHVEGDMGGGLSQRLDALLHATSMSRPSCGAPPPPG